MTSRSPKDAAKEEERIQKLTDKRKHETEVQRKKRLQTEEKTAKTPASL